MAVDVQPNGSDSSDAIAPDINGTPTGSPTSSTPTIGGPSQQPQPAAPPKETIGQGLARGATGTKYVVDGQGNMVDARTTAPSAAGTFGSILSGVVMGALAGAKTARPGRIPSSEVGGGFGAGVASAEADAQQRDQRNRTQAQQDFTNRNQAQKMSREQAESAAVINHLSAQTASELSATQRANEEHPLNMALKRAGLDEASQSLQKGYQDLAKNSLDMMKTLTDSGINPSAMPTSWADGKPHVGDIVQGRSVPLHNGETGEGQGAGIFDVQQLRQTPLTTAAVFKTYTADKDGNPVEKINTLPVGTTAFDYVSAAMAGKAQLKDILSQQAVKQATELHKATIREKNATAFKEGAEGKKAEAETVGMKDAIQGQAEDLVESNMDPSQIQKRGNQYTPILAAAREYSMKKYGVPFDIAKAQEDYKFASDPKTQNRLKYMNSLVGDERTGSTGNLDLLVQYSDAVKRTKFPALNDVAAWARLESGDGNIVKFHNAAVDAADQFANIMNGGGSGSATSDAKIKQGLDMFNKGFNKDQIRDSASSVKDMLSNRKREFIGDNRYLRKQYLPQSQSGAQTQTQSQQQQPRQAQPPAGAKNAIYVNGQIVGYN